MPWEPEATLAKTKDADPWCGTRLYQAWHPGLLHQCEPNCMSLCTSWSGNYIIRFTATTRRTCGKPGMRSP